MQSLNDRHVPFPEKLSTATQILKAPFNEHLTESLLNWALLTLLKLSKVENPRHDVFLAPELWSFLKLLLLRAFPDEPKMYTVLAKRVREVSCEQPLLPAFHMYLALGEGPVILQDFIDSLLVFDRLEVGQVGGQIGNFLEFLASAVSRNFSQVICIAINLLLRAFEAGNRKKSLPVILEALPSILNDMPDSPKVKAAVDKLLIKIFVENVPVYSFPTLEPAASDHLSHVLTCLSSLKCGMISQIYQLYLAKRVRRNDDSDRMEPFSLIFALYNNYLKGRPDGPAAMANMLQAMNANAFIYQHRNDQVYRQQEELLVSLASCGDARICEAILGLDFYLIMDRLEGLRGIIDARLQVSLFRMAVQARQVDSLISKFDNMGIPPLDKHGLYEAVSKCTKDILRHLEATVTSLEYWEILFYLSLPNLTDSEKQERLARIPHGTDMYARCKLMLGESNASILPELPYVPLMAPSQFSEYLDAQPPLPDILKMLRQSHFYELGFDKQLASWLIKQEADVKGECLSLIPGDYLSTKTVKKLLGVDGVDRFLRRRPKLLRWILRKGGDASVVKYAGALARFAVKQDHIGFVERLLKLGLLKEVLNAEPPKEKFAELILAHVNLAEVDESLAGLLLPYLDSFDELTSRGLLRTSHPYLYSLPLSPTANLSMSLPHYPLNEQISFLESVHLDTHHVNQLLQAKGCREAILKCLVEQKMVCDLSTAKLLLSMTKAVSDESLQNLIPNMLDVLQHLDTNDLESAIDTLNQMALHRWSLCVEFADGCLRVLMKIMMHLQSESMDSLLCHDFNKLLSTITHSRHRPTPSTRDLFLMLLLSYAQSSPKLPFKNRVILNAGMYGVMARLEGELQERVMAWCRDAEREVIRTLYEDYRKFYKFTD